MKHLFAYGTLMCKDIILEVSGFKPDSVKGELTGYIRRAVRGAHYPAIKSCAGCKVEGIIYLNLPEEAWERLDLFEGELYRRTSLRVIADNYSTIEAETYVIQQSFRHLLSSKRWDIEDFLRSGKHHFKSHYLGFHQLK